MFKEIKVSYALTLKQQATRVAGIQAAFSKGLSLTAASAVIVYVDNAVYTTSTLTNKTWMTKYSVLRKKSVNKRHFYRVAAVASIDSDGKVFYYLLTKDATEIDSFIDFFGKIGDN